MPRPRARGVAYDIRRLRGSGQVAQQTRMALPLSCLEQFVGRRYYPEMQSKATSVDQYLAGLPADRRDAIEAVRAVILENLPKGYEEGMQYGMIGYYVPHRVYPAGYHCDPLQPLPFAALASQKNHMSLYLMCIYGNPEHEAHQVEGHVVLL